ncbi:hypothetical protein B484DRAFT_418529 [Ochromonadaceae sp. CCMP2298]|nr:hypothetical protein B484DRAFT_418529 [Ochromonadaceae sp. CCMP2298]
MGRYSTFGARKKSVYKSHDHAILSGVEYYPPGTQPVTQPGTQPGTPPGTPATPAMVAATPAVVAVTTAAALLTPKTAMIKELTKQDQLGAAQKLQQGGEAYKAFLTSFLVPLNEDIESILWSLLEVGILDESTVESLRAGIQDRRSGNLMSKVEGYGKVEGAAIYDAAMDAPAKLRACRKLEKQLHGFIEFALFVRPSLQAQLTAKMKQSLRVDFSAKRIAFLMDTSSAFNLTALNSIVKLEKKEKFQRGSISTPKQVSKVYRDIEELAKAYLGGGMNANSPLSPQSPLPPLSPLPLLPLLLAPPPLLAPARACPQGSRLHSFWGVMTLIETWGFHYHELDLGELREDASM